MLGAALPVEAKLFGVDLSPHYIARAREILPRDLDVSLVCDNAENLPFVDESFDAVTSAYLLHEVPAEVRARVLAEMARVVRPAGRWWSPTASSSPTRRSWSARSSPFLRGSTSRSTPAT